MPSPRKYATTGAAAVSAARTVLTVIATTAIRPSVYDIQLGFAAPADLSIEWILQRITTAGTVSAVVPAAIDSGDPASTATSGENASAEPTKTAAMELIDEELNQRASYRWVAAPGGELVAPATAANGFALICIHASGTPTARATMHFSE